MNESFDFVVQDFQNFSKPATHLSRSLSLVGRIFCDVTENSDFEAENRAAAIR